MGRGAQSVGDAPLDTASKQADWRDERRMKTTNLGSTGLRVSGLCLGTMTFGAQCDVSESHEILDAAAEGGIDFLDTADVYPAGGDRSSGRTEEILGEWLRGKRERFVVATKCVGQTGPKPWDQGMSRKHILDAIDRSLKRLRTDYVDLYQLHRYDPSTPLDEALEALDVVVRSGRARYVGVSNWPAFRVARALGRSELGRGARLVSVQPRYNLLFRLFERDLLTFCAEEGVAVLPYNPLAGGLLTGKHQRDASPPRGSRFTIRSYKDRYWHDREFDTVEALRSVAGEAGISMTALALRWILSNPAITAPIVGASRPAHVQEALAAAEQGPLPADLKAGLDTLTHAWRSAEADR